MSASGNVQQGEVRNRGRRGVTFANTHHHERDEERGDESVSWDAQMSERLGS